MTTEFHCEKCDLYFATKQRLDVHYKSKKHINGTKPVNYVCSLCKFQSKNKLDYNRHLETPKCINNHIEAKQDAKYKKYMDKYDICGWCDVQWEKNTLEQNNHDCFKNKNNSKPIYEPTWSHLKVYSKCHHNYLMKIDSYYNYRYRQDTCSPCEDEKEDEIEIIPEKKLPLNFVKPDPLYDPVLWKEFDDITNFDFDENKSNMMFVLSHTPGVNKKDLDSTRQYLSNN